MTHYEFPGRGVLNWALLLPFAVPAYVIAYVYTDLLEFAGPVQSALRAAFGWQLASEYTFPAIRSLPGAIAMLVLVLYPLRLSPRPCRLSRAVGLGARGRPRARRQPYGPLLPGGAPDGPPGDRGRPRHGDDGDAERLRTVDYFAVRTLTAGLYDVWLRMKQLGGGAQIATLLLTFVMVLIALERISRAHRENFQPSGTRLPGARAARAARLAGGARGHALRAAGAARVRGARDRARRYAVLRFETSWTADFRRSRSTPCCSRPPPRWSRSRSASS